VKQSVSNVQKAGKPGKIKNSITSLFALLVFVVNGLPAVADTTPPGKPEVIIDAGHTAKMSGATSITGKREVEYNDKLVAQLSNALAKSGFTPTLTRQPNQEIKLENRAAIANSHNAILMLSIHHDSAQLTHLEPVVRNGIKTYRTRTPIAGYSIFVSRKNRQFGSSLAFARLLGHEMLNLGRKPSLHHTEPIPGEGRPLLDATLGIYQFDDLVVLKKTAIPAVLLEVGVIVDKADEAYVSNGKNQQAIVKAIVTAIGRFSGATPGPIETP
jgi:N-acetylmuramoyl-L-alanine amidase